jgi:hypothetical protein
MNPLHEAVQLLSVGHKELRSLKSQRDHPNGRMSAKRLWYCLLLSHIRIRHWMGSLGVVAQERLQQERLKKTPDLIVEEYEKLEDLLFKDQEVFLQYDDDSFDHLVIPIDRLLPQQHIHFAVIRSHYDTFDHFHPTEIHPGELDGLSSRAASPVTDSDSETHPSRKHTHRGRRDLSNPHQRERPLSLLASILLTHHLPQSGNALPGILAKNQTPSTRTTDPIK